MNFKKKKVIVLGMSAMAFTFLTAFTSPMAGVTAVIYGDGVAGEEQDSAGEAAGVPGEETADDSLSIDNQAEEVTEDEAALPEEDWESRVMAEVDDSVNIRAEADENSEVVGKLFKGGAADVIEEGAVWTKIRSGSVEGYVKNEYLAFGEEAKNIADEEGRVIGTVQTETLKVREDASEEAKVVDLAAIEDTFTIVDAVDGWLEIQFEGGETAYVSGDYVETELVLGEAKSTEEIQAEEAAKAAAAAKTTAASQASSASNDDVMLLAALIQCEAGSESYEGKLAVGSVVMNRVRSGSYPNSISGVVYQGGQFPPATNGSVGSVMASGPSSSCIEAARAAIGGANNVGGATSFRSARAGGSVVIGNHAFY